MSAMITPERRQAIKEQVKEFGTKLQRLDDVVIVELQNNDDMEAYQDECDRGGYLVEQMEQKGPTGADQIIISLDPEEYRRKNPL